MSYEPMLLQRALEGENDAHDIMFIPQLRYYPTSKLEHPYKARVRPKCKMGLFGIESELTDTSKSASVKGAVKSKTHILHFVVFVVWDRDDDSKGVTICLNYFWCIHLEL